jgi:hypothetical protein
MKYYQVMVQEVNLYKTPVRKGIDYKNLDKAITFANRYAQRKDIVKVWILDEHNQIVKIIIEKKFNLQYRVRNA